MILSLLLNLESLIIIRARDSGHLHPLARFSFRWDTTLLLTLRNLDLGFTTLGGSLDDVTC